MATCEIKLNLAFIMALGRKAAFMYFTSVRHALLLSGVISLLTGICSALLLSPLACAGEIASDAGDEREVAARFDDVVERASSFPLVGSDRIAADALAFGEFSVGGRSWPLPLVEPGGGHFSGIMGSTTKELVPPARFRARPPGQEYSVRVRMPEAKSGLALPRIDGPTDASRPLVVIDAGHGGHDPGAISPHGGQREKDLTLQLALALRDKLLEGGRIRVALTRESDKFLVLEERYGIARQLGADLFISIHADAADRSEARGATVYTLSEVASDREAARLAARENKANVINGVNLGGTTDDVSSILIDLTQRETMNLSTEFAKLVLREGRGNVPFRSESHRFASFVVLKAPDVPSILFESGYLTNEGDLEFLTSPTGQSKFADSVAEAVTIYFARRLTMN